MRIFSNPTMRYHIEAYNQSHRNRVNRALHSLGIPAAAIAVFGLLSKLRVYDWEIAGVRPDAGWVAVLIAGLWYLWCDWKTGLLPMVGLVACYLAGQTLEPWILISMLGVAALLHVVGHFGFEGKPPALLSRPIALLEAPAWLIALFAGNGLR